MLGTTIGRPPSAAGVTQHPVLRVPRSRLKLRGSEHIHIVNTRKTPPACHVADRHARLCYRSCCYPRFV